MFSSTSPSKPFIVKQAAPAVPRVKRVQVLDDFHLVQQAPDRQLLGHAGGTGPTVDQRTGHVGGNDQKLLGKPGFVILGVSGRQPGQHEAAGNVLPGDVGEASQLGDVLEELQSGQQMPPSAHRPAALPGTGTRPAARGRQLHAFYVSRSSRS